MKEIQPRRAIHAEVRIPGSKSLSHRALIAAALAEGRSLISNLSHCEDVLFTMGALRSLGIDMRNGHGALAVSGSGGRFPPSAGTKSIFLGSSGTSYRFLLSVASLARGDFLLDCSPSMRERPVGGLVKALNGLGGQIVFAGRDNFPPVHVKGKGLRGGRVRMEGNTSSQYVSSLLLAAPYAEKPLEVEVQGDLFSSPYVDLTIDVMARFGMTVDRAGTRYFRVSPGRGYRRCDFAVEGDVSGASYFWAAAAVTGGRVVTENIHPQTTRQGDIAFLHVLEQMGCTVLRHGEAVAVSGGPLQGIEADMSAMPDMVPTLAAIALFAKGTTVIRNVPHLRHKESDRLRSIAQELGRLKGQVEELPDGLMIQGKAPLSGTITDPHDDHRMAMSLAVIGLMVPGVRIRNEDCVSKSFPGFWEIWDTI
jgi:3-phosphoshikimate 1-carboxyvinyltransferase